MEAKERLRDIIWNGLQVDIYEAEESLALVREIGLNASAINAAKYGFGHLFGRLQHSNIEIAILAVNRLYDKPKTNKYPLRSLPSAIDLLQKSSSVLKLENRRSVTERLIEFGQSEREVRALADAEITELLAVEYERGLPAAIAGDSSGLNAIKFRRDKKLAHPEAITAEAILPVSFKQIHGLLTFAKDFISVIGHGYLNIIYRFDDGEYFLTKDANGIVRPLMRLLRGAKILE